MGQGSSVLAIHGRIDAILPHHTFELCSNNKQRAELIADVQPLFPGGHNDRQQFVHSIRILLSGNGKVNLGDKRFKLVFTRAEQHSNADADDDSEAQIYVSIVAVAPDGILAAKVASDRAGQDKIEAFKLFRKTVEMHMHRILDSVPGPDDVAASSRAPMLDRERNASAATLASTILPDDTPDHPPSYHEANK